MREIVETESVVWLGIDVRMVLVVFGFERSLSEPPIIFPLYVGMMMPPLGITKRLLRTGAAL